MVKVRRLGVALALVVFLGFAGSAAAAYTSRANFIASCSQSAYANIGGSGHAYIDFYGFSGNVMNSQYRNLGAGSSSHVATGVGGSYSHVILRTPNGSGYISSVGCGF